MKRSLLSILQLTFLLSLTSCVNENYDLSKIEVNEISGLEGISVPVGSSTMISVEDILGFRTESNDLKTDDDGNYYFSFGDDEALSRTINVPKFSFDGYDDDQSRDFTISSPVVIPDLWDGFVTPVIPFTDLVYELEIDQNNLPELIGSIAYANVSSRIGVDFSYDQSTLPLKKIILAKEATITFPEWVVLGAPSNMFKKLNDHTVELANDFHITPNGASIVLPVQGLDFSKLPKGQGVIAPGHLHLDADIHLTGGIIINSSDCLSIGTYKPVVSTNLYLEPINVEALRLSKISLGDEARSSHTVELGDIIPQVLYDEGLVLDFDDLALKVSHYNGLPFAGNVAAMIDTYKDEHPVRKCSFNFDLVYQLNSIGNNIVNYFTESGKNSSIKVDGLNSILNPTPDKFYVSTEITLDDLEEHMDDEDYGLIVPGASYRFSGGYEFIAPLSFGSDFRLNLTEDITGFKLNIPSLELAEAQLKLNFVNALPFDIDLKGEAIDADGNVLPHISVELSGEVKGGTISAPSVNPLVLTFKNKGDLKIDGVRLNMNASTSSANSVLNKKQFIQFKDMRLSLPKGITYYFGDNN